MSSAPDKPKVSATGDSEQGDGGLWRSRSPRTSSTPLALALIAGALRKVECPVVTLARLVLGTRLQPEYLIEGEVANGILCHDAISRWI
jgi:hypothetical protein